MKNNHNTKKERPLYAKYIKEAVLNVFGLKTEDEFNEDISRFDNEETKELVTSILQGLKKNNRAKLLCIIPEQKSNLPQITFSIKNDELCISNNKLSQSRSFNINGGGNITEIIKNQTDELFKTYPELWLLNRESKTTYYARWMIGYNDDRTETLELVYSNAIKDINKFGVDSPQFIHALAQRDMYGTWKITDCSNEDINIITQEAIRYVDELRETSGVQYFRKVIENLDAGTLSLDFRLKEGNHFEVTDWDCGRYDAVMRHAEEILRYPHDQDNKENHYNP